jgi:hypothetical protein
MKPLPFSPSSLDMFVNCGRQYQALYVTKEVERQAQGEAQLYGVDVHKAFEDRQAQRIKLPPALSMHEPKMALLESWPGVFYTERKVALTKPPEMRPVSWEWRKEELWFRGVIDYIKLDREAKRAWIVDYKTGKPHEKLRQLTLYALYVFIAFKSIDLVNVQFYWTRDPERLTKKVWGRHEMDQMWGEVIGDLKQYKEAFKNDIWQARPSGLCYGYCPLQSCQHWRPMRQR